MCTAKKVEAIPIARLQPIWNARYFRAAGSQNGRSAAPNSKGPLPPSVVGWCCRRISKVVTIPARAATTASPERAYSARPPSRATSSSTPALSITTVPPRVQSAVRRPK